MSIENDLRRDVLEDEYARWDIWYIRVNAVRVTWRCRPAGTDGDPTFETNSYEEMELFLSKHDPKEVSS